MAAMEETHLEQADRHIAEAEQHIANQEQRISTLDAAGYDTTEGRRLLAAFRDTLEQMLIHRRLIIARIGAA